MVFGLGGKSREEFFQAALVPRLRDVDFRSGAVTENQATRIGRVLRG
jgi:hypothetical protein